LPAYALTPTETAALEKQIRQARIVEVPAVAARLVTAAEAKDVIDTAVTVVVAGIKAHPTALTSVVTSVLKVAPDATEAVVGAAIQAAPDKAVAVVRAAAEAAPAKSDKAVEVASRMAPKNTTAFEREVAQVQTRRLNTTTPVAAALTGGSVSQTPVAGSAPTTIVNVYAGGDPVRP
jgi:hypothetical protein